MNAIPSDSRTPRTRRAGQASFRDGRFTTGPQVLRVPVQGCGFERGEPVRLKGGRIGGKRRAKKASRSGPVAWLNAQGRVGHRSRHIALHLAVHRLLSAPASADPKADCSLPVSRSRSGRGGLETTRADSARTEAQPLSRLMPAREAHDAKLVPNGFDATALVRGLSRGKGVLAA